MTMPRTLLLATLLTTTADALPAQAPKPREFFFDDYRNVVHVDMTRVRSTGVWDEIASSGLKLVFGMMNEQFGFPLERLDRVTAVRAPLARDDGGAEMQEIVVVEGNGDLGAMRDVRHGRYREASVGDYTMLHDQWFDGHAVVQVRDELRVHGPASLLEDVLRGKPRAGRPAPDVLAFVGGEQRLLAFFCADFADDRDMKDALHAALPDTEWPDGDQPSFAGGRLLATGDADDPHLTIELVLRHGTAGDGLAATEKAVTAALERLAARKEALLFRPLLAKIEHERDGTDAVWRLDLGRARQAAGVAGTLMPFLVVTRTAEAAQVIEVVEAAEEAPAPKKEKGK